VAARDSEGSILSRRKVDKHLSPAKRRSVQPARPIRRPSIAARLSVESDGRSAWFPGLGRGRWRYGVGVAIALAEVAGGRPQVRVVRRGSFSAGPAQRHRERLLEAVGEIDLARAFVGLGQRQRIRISRAILAGANSHHLLAKSVGLAAGPLYHHLRSLERAGLLTFVERNRYDLSPLGRDLLLAASVLCGAARQRRR